MIKPTNSMEQRFSDFYKLSYLSQTKNVNALFGFYSASTRFFPRLASIDVIGWLDN